MPAFVIGSVTVPLAPGAIPMVREDTAVYRRLENGDMDMEVVGEFARVRAWRATTLPMSRTAADALQAQLRIAGTIELTGDEVGAPAQTCYARAIRRRDISRGGGSGTNDRCVVTFEAHGVDG